MNGEWRDNVQVFVERSNFGRSNAVFLFKEDPLGNSQFVLPFDVKWSEVFPDDRALQVSAPAINFTSREGQALMDALWNAGLRPTAKNLDPNPQIEAMKAHLDDTRKLAFDHLLPVLLDQLRK